MVDVELVDLARAALASAQTWVPANHAEAYARCCTQPHHLAVLSVMLVEEWSIEGAAQRLDEDVRLQRALGLECSDERERLFADMRLLGTGGLARVRAAAHLEGLVKEARRRAEWQGRAPYPRGFVLTASRGGAAETGTPSAGDAPGVRPGDGDLSALAETATDCVPPAAPSVSDARSVASADGSQRDLVPVAPEASERQDLAASPAETPVADAPGDTHAPAPASGAPGDAPDHVVVPSHPVRADGVQMLGVLRDSGYQSQQWLVQRNGRFIQLSELLYRIAEQADGQRSLEEIAATVAQATGRPVSANNVALLIGARLLPLGIIAGPDAPAPPPARSPLQVSIRAAVIGPRVLRPVTRALAFLYSSPIVMSVLVMVAVTHWWLYVQHGVAQSLLEVIGRPDLFLVLVPLVLVSALFHEFGHATALRHGGGEARKIGIGFYLMYPTFYTDITDSYRLGRWARIRTDLGGFYFNLIFTLGVMGAYALTHQEFLLVLVVWTDLDIIEQWLPFVRFDGYWAVADVIGIPDWFTLLRPYLGSVARRVLPWKRHQATRLPPLKPWVRIAFGLYVLLAIPLLAGLLALMVVVTPFILSTTSESLFRQVVALEGAWAGADVLGTLTALLQALILVLTVAGLVVSLCVLARSAMRTLWRWGAASRVRRVFVAAVMLAAAVLFATYWVAPMASEIAHLAATTFASSAPDSGAPPRASALPAVTSPAAKATTALQPGTPGGTDASAQDSLPSAALDAPTRAQWGSRCAPRVAFGTTVPSTTHIVRGQAITITTTLTVACAEHGLVDFEISALSGTRVWQGTLDDQPLSGQPQSFSIRWVPAANLAPAQYWVGIGVFGPGWSGLYGWQGAVLTLSLSAPDSTCPAVPAISFGNPTLSAHDVAPGSALWLGMSVRAACSSGAAVLVDVRNAAGTQVWRVSFGEVNLGPSWKSFGASWSVPTGLAPGVYRAEVRVLDPGGNTLYAVAAIGKVSIGQVTP